MPPVGFEPMIPVLTQEKTVHASGRAATVIGKISIHVLQMFLCAVCIIFQVLISFVSLGH
jgi:hypothetical protein